MSRKYSIAQAKGIAKAKSAGKYTGKKTKYSLNDPNVTDALSQYQHRLQNHLSATQIARDHHMSRVTLYRKVKQYNNRQAHSSMSIRKNRYLLQRNLALLIHNGGHLFTGLKTSLSAVTTILHNDTVPKDTLPSEVESIMHLKKGFEYIIHHQGPLNLKVFSDINRFVAYDSLDPGYFSYRSMQINGVKWRPPVPSTKRANHFIRSCKRIQSGYSIRAINLMLLFDRYQFFWDGNKRTAWLAANYYMLQHGAGVLNINTHQQTTFDHYLLIYDNTGKKQYFVQWLDQHCVTRKL